MPARQVSARNGTDRLSNEQCVWHLDYSLNEPESKEGPQAAAQTRAHLPDTTCRRHFNFILCTIIKTILPAVEASLSVCSSPAKACKKHGPRQLPSRRAPKNTCYERSLALCRMPYISRSCYLALTFPSPLPLFPGWVRLVLTWL